MWTATTYLNISLNTVTLNIHFYNIHIIWVGSSFGMSIILRTYTVTLALKIIFTNEHFKTILILEVFIIVNCSMIDDNFIWISIQLYKLD